ncbi:MAG: M23 family metallopeptidase, partial [Acidimicrobiales bacterium]
QMRRLLPPVVIAILVTIGLATSACSSAGPSTSSGSSGASASAGVGDSLGGDPALGVTVPDAFTSLSLTPVGRGTFPFLGTDGKYHVAYDLVILNTTPYPATLDKLDVVDAAHPTKVIASYSGTNLVDPSCSYGNCNRLRYIYSGPVTDTTIPAHESRLMYVDFAFDSLAVAPKTVLHHVYLTGKTNLTSKDLGPFDYLATPYDISDGAPLVISPPLKGTNWVAFNGCCEPGFPHRNAILPANGVIGNSQTFAIDWKRANNAGAFYTGDKTKNQSFVDYGEPVYAVADATVVGVLDNVDANAPGIQPTQDPATAAKITLQNVDGNHVILDLGHGVWAMYAHFQRGSIKVKVGDKVKKGQEIALLGNTGNANASHLHFQLMDGPNILTANGLPYVFDSFTYEGQVPLQQVLTADNYLTGNFFSEKLATGQPRKDQRPLNLDIVDFPS